MLRKRWRLILVWTSSNLRESGNQVVRGRRHCWQRPQLVKGLRRDILGRRIDPARIAFRGRVAEAFLWDEDGIRLSASRFGPSLAHWQKTGALLIWRFRFLLALRLICHRVRLERPNIPSLSHFQLAQDFRAALDQAIKMVRVGNGIDRSDLRRAFVVLGSQISDIEKLMFAR